MEALDLARGEVVAVEVAPEALLDAGAQDFHGDGAPPGAVVDDGLVHLRYGGSRDGRADLHEVILEPAPERLLDGFARLLLRERRQAVLQVREILRELRPDHVGAR